MSHEVYAKLFLQCISHCIVSIFKLVPKYFQSLVYFPLLQLCLCTAVSNLCSVHFVKKKRAIYGFFQ